MPFLCIRRPRSSPSSSPSPLTTTTTVTTQSQTTVNPAAVNTFREPLTTGQPQHHRSIPNGARSGRGNQAPIEPQSSSSSQEPAFSWQDINPPTDHSCPVDHHSHHPHSTSPPSEKLENMLDSTREMTTSLPGYNDVSGAVVVDWNGLPHFLSPQEEHERKMKLQRAVQERMLGLSRRTDFKWERPSHGETLPRYSPPKDKRVRK